MDYALSEQQEAFRETAARFAQEKLAPHYQRRAAEDRIDRNLLKEMGALGLIGADLPEQYGGLGESSVTAGIIIEQIAYADFNLSYVPLLASLMGSMLAQHASPDIAREWLPKVTGGRSHCRPRPDRAARRIGRRQSRSARGKIRKWLPPERREDIDQLFRSMRGRGHFRPHRTTSRTAPAASAPFSSISTRTASRAPISTISAPSRSGADRYSSTTSSFRPSA